MLEQTLVSQPKDRIHIHIYVLKPNFCIESMNKTSIFWHRHESAVNQELLTWLSLGMNHGAFY